MSLLQELAVLVLTVLLLMVKTVLQKTLVGFGRLSTWAVLWLWNTRAHWSSQSHVCQFKFTSRRSLVPIHWRISSSISFHYRSQQCSHRCSITSTLLIGGGGEHQWRRQGTNIDIGIFFLPWKLTIPVSLLVSCIVHNYQRISFISRIVWVDCWSTDNSRTTVF